MSDRAAGWGFSLVTLVAFLVTLFVGLAKIGVEPAGEQEHYGETFAPLALSDFPESQVTRIAGSIPESPTGKPLPTSVQRQLREQNGEVVFRGWMLPNQKSDLADYEKTLQWQCLIEQLAETAQPPEALRGKASYYADHSALSFRGWMDDADRSALSAISDEPAWTDAIEQLYERSRRTTRVDVPRFPRDWQVPEPLQEVVSYDTDAGWLEIRGPMSSAQRDQLGRQFALIKPLDESQRDSLLAEIEARGEPLTELQRVEFHRLLDGTWTIAQLADVLNEAGQPEEVEKTACEMLEEMQAGVRPIRPTRTEGEPVELNDVQREVLAAFAGDPQMSLDRLIELLEEAGEFVARQKTALRTFFGMVPTVGHRNRALYFELLKAGPLTEEQADYLLADYREQLLWQAAVGNLYQAAHVPKYGWSGNYRSQGSPFWWLYEYAFKPLTATMFAMLAFYVASAAFRAFRAKNLEAILLLGTAFIILLGRTFAGVLLTSWFPEAIAGLRIENLTMTVMSVFNTAGNRAIMIGIALGIASTSLKVLLGIDRSYLGSRES